MSTPVVDVTIAVHTAARPIARAVRSVLTGNAAPVGVTVIAHNIDSNIIHKNLGELAEDPRVRLLHLNDGIPSPAGPMNLGFESSDSQYFAVMGSDDELAPGAIDSWLGVARRNNAAAVIARVQHVGGQVEPSPPVRVGRVAHLDPVKDRLAYRSAPLGLLRRQEFGRLRLPSGLRSGEDIPFVAAIWFSGAELAFDRSGPAYLVHADSEDRVTMNPRPITQDFAFLDHLLDDEALQGLPAAARHALAVKTIRVHVFDAILNRRPLGAWPDGERMALAEVVLRLIDWGDTPQRVLSVRDRQALAAVLDLSISDEELSARVAVRSRYLHPLALVPRNPLRIFDRQGPFRTLFSGWLLLRE